MKLNNLILLCCLGLFLITACENSTTETLSDTFTSSGEDIANFDDLFADIGETVDLSMSNLEDDQALESRSSCVTKTWENPPHTFPNTLTIDFGDGCEFHNGRTRSGKIIITQSAPMNEAGAVREVTTENYFVDSVQVLGLKRKTNNGTNTAGFRSFTTEIIGGQLIYPNGLTASLDAIRTMTQTEGGNTMHPLDDVHEITGNATGVNRNGDTFSTTVVDPLIKQGICRFIVSGLLEIDRNGNTATLDYGDGLCNRVGLLTLPDGTTREVKIMRRFW